MVSGATTALFGVLPLGFAGNIIFRVFFKIFLVVIPLAVRLEVPRFLLLVAWRCSAEMLMFLNLLELFFVVVQHRRVMRHTMSGLHRSCCRGQAACFLPVDATVVRVAPAQNPPCSRSW